MAAAILCCTFVLLLYLQGNYAQQGSVNNQNGVNNAIGFQQEVLQRTNIPNNMNQIPNGGLNMNLPLQSNFQQSNLQQPVVSGNFLGNMQPSMSPQANLQPQQGGSVSFGNFQITKQGLQLPPGLVINPSKSQTDPTQTGNGCRQNVQMNQQSNMGPIANMPTSQAQNAPNSLAELAALKGHPSLLSLFASQNNMAQPQQNQPMANFNPSINQLSDAQKQFLVRALQSQSSVQNQPTASAAQFRVAGADSWPTIAFQGVPPQHAQAIVTPIASQQPYIAVQAQPLNNYMQNQPQQLAEEPSILNLILSQLQAYDPKYNMYPPYSVQKTESKSSLKTLIPIIINLLKEKNTCSCQNNGCPNNGCPNNGCPNNGCPNNGCPNNGCATNHGPEPTIFGGYSSLMNYGQGASETTTKSCEVEEKKTKSKKKKKNIKKNVVKDDSEEGSEGYDSEEADYSEEE